MTSNSDATSADDAATGEPFDPEAGQRDLHAQMATEPVRSFDEAVGAEDPMLGKNYLIDRAMKQDIDDNKREIDKHEDNTGKEATDKSEDNTGKEATDKSEDNTGKEATDKSEDKFASLEKDTDDTGGESTFDPEFERRAPGSDAAVTDQERPGDAVL